MVVGKPGDAPQTTERDETSLVAALCRGEPEATEVVWRRFSPLVRRVMQRTVGAADVDDAVQEVFLRVFDRVASLRRPEALTAFILTITANTARWQLRRKAIRRLIRFTNDGSPPVDERVTLPDPAGREALQAFYRALDRVGADDRLVFVLRFVEELDVAVIAESLGVSLSTTKRRIAQAWESVAQRVRAEPALTEYLEHNSRRDEGGAP